MRGSHDLMKDALGITATFEAVPGMGHSGVTMWYRIVSSTCKMRGLLLLLLL